MFFCFDLLMHELFLIFLYLNSYDLWERKELVQSRRYKSASQSDSLLLLVQNVWEDGSVVLLL